jgi:hypothetical protein
MITRILFAAGAIALLAAPAAWAGEDCGFGHSRTTAQTAQSEATLPQTAPVEQAAATVPDTDETAATTVAVAAPQTQQQ